MEGKKDEQHIPLQVMASPSSDARMRTKTQEIAELPDDLHGIVTEAIDFFKSKCFTPTDTKSIVKYLPDFQNYKGDVPPLVHRDDLTSFLKKSFGELQEVIDQTEGTYFHQPKFLYIVIVVFKLYKEVLPEVRRIISTDLSKNSC
jgi:hypothetical protein